ncbi:LOG family protein [Streptomyces sp. NPDC051658]|uniref:SLOG cluster 4 domain-containing protein n=1 Tax=Streptomyces sp. NPDC051658 TaxID=3365667 RepID=UPI0037A9E439
MNSTDLTAALFAGVVPPDGEEPLAEAAGAALARAGYALKHGGYNGLMEAAARGAARHGAPVTAVTLADRPDWGALNPHVTTTVYAPTVGARLHAYLDDADLVVAMGGGVGTLHELTAAPPLLRIRREHDGASSVTLSPYRLSAPPPRSAPTRGESCRTRSPEAPLRNHENGMGVPLLSMGLLPGWINES